MVFMSPARYAPSEAAIEDAIESRIGNPGFFQRVAEQVACGLYPDLANSLVPFGRRPDEKTVRGWPDAYLKKADGTLIAIWAIRDKWNCGEGVLNGHNGRIALYRAAGGTGSLRGRRKRSKELLAEAGSETLPDRRTLKF